MKCNKCGSTENTKEFTYFDKNKKEWLCWDCREPIIMERLHSQSDPEETWTPDDAEAIEHLEGEDEEDKQSGITDFL